MWRNKLAILCLLIPLQVRLMPIALAQDSSASIQQVMQRQVQAWNHGDIEAFMHGYNNAADTTFIGKTLEQGYAPILARYKKAYPGHEAMGTLDFSEISVRMLGSDYAVATGKFHLARTAAGGGDASGIFSLVWEETQEGWKIILDHTTSE
ncbi:L-asparaginase [Acidisarcina polymorpha]|uniref:L-asparaginase n=1 Tax=Acidisarcina polymorpha TaxID=2211140 RepID=A0A2Z5FWB5_9BACT|nr:SgcJ/EcaC family oxidoreductase [Acidisarcina polymorpha]AXC11121.1 L-asparaginase [Acidisarcina polymorpha]